MMEPEWEAVGFQRPKNDAYNGRLQWVMLGQQARLKDDD